MLGSLQDAEDLLQETLIGAWRGYDRFEGRSSLRTWLYRIATNACIRIGQKCPSRILSMDHGPAFTDVWELGEWSPEIPWLEPFPARLVDAATPSVNPAGRYEVRESLELAFVAAVQHLPPTQRAVLILREVLAFPAAEVSDLLDTTVASVNSALQRARATMAARTPSSTQADELARMGDQGVAAFAATLVDAWDRADIDALLTLLTDDVTFAMPPIPAWFDGRHSVEQFLRQRVAATPWRHRLTGANGQLALACYQEHEPGTPLVLSAINVLTLRDGRICGVIGFLDPAITAAFGFPEVYPGPESTRPDR